MPGPVYTRKQALDCYICGPRAGAGSHFLLMAVGFAWDFAARASSSSRAAGHAAPARSTCASSLAAHTIRAARLENKSNHSPKLDMRDETGVPLSQYSCARWARKPMPNIIRRCACSCVLPPTPQDKRHPAALVVPCCSLLL